MLTGCFFTSPARERTHPLRADAHDYSLLLQDLKYVELPYLFNMAAAAHHVAPRIEWRLP
jgi:hypothetical protein